MKWKKKLTTSEILDLRDALRVLEKLKTTLDQRELFADTDTTAAARMVLDLPAQFEETDTTIRDAFAPIYSIINNEIEYMRQYLADIEYTNATPETFQKGFKGFDEYTDGEILDQYDFYIN